jgi:hypothetical protein
MHAPQSCGQESQVSPLQSPLPQQTALHIIAAPLTQMLSHSLLQQ